MALPPQPVTLNPEQVADLNKALSACRHNINNQLALVVAATELIKANPAVLERMLKTLAEQPPKITEELRKFSVAFEQALCIHHP